MSFTTLGRRVVTGAAGVGVGLLFLVGVAAPAAFADDQTPIGTQGPVVSEPVQVQLPKYITHKICGGFGGTIIWSDGTSLDCTTGTLVTPQVSPSS